PVIEDFFVGRKQEWELHRNDCYLFGQQEIAPGAQQYIHIPDSGMTQLHAEIREEGKNFYLQPHKTNRGPNGSAYTLRLKHAHESSETRVVEKMQLEDGDEIGMGRTKFLFSLHGKDRVKHVIIAAAAITFLMLLSSRHVYAQATDQLSEAQFALADRVRLYQCLPGSEQPCFSIAVNVVDRNNNVLPIKILNPQQTEQQVQIFEGDSQLRVVHVDQGFDAGKPRRIAILLVDVSGSMLDSTDPLLDKRKAMKAHRTKFHAMKKACLRFAEDFADGVDQVAVIPFASYKVIKGVNEAIVCDSKQCLEAQINNLATPNRQANTGLYSAVQAAIERLQAERSGAIAAGYQNPQCMLVVMTDGVNNVGHKGDDSNLLRDFEPVQSLAVRVGLPIITVGFGEAQSIDE
ncbi:MAG TPA: VWA domain-containing protein, partial [Nitrososphaera sp.]|nr:VWA domain-containing protein [Nitrososphaera sp.]